MQRTLYGALVLTLAMLLRLINCRFIIIIIIIIIISGNSTINMCCSPPLELLVLEITCHLLKVCMCRSL